MRRPDNVEETAREGMRESRDNGVKGGVQVRREKRAEGKGTKEPNFSEGWIRRSRRQRKHWRKVHRDFTNIIVTTVDLRTIVSYSNY